MIDPFSQMKREYNTTLGDADSVIYITLSYPGSELYMMLSGKRFLR